LNEEAPSMQQVVPALRLPRDTLRPFHLRQAVKGSDSAKEPSPGQCGHIWIHYKRSLSGSHVG